MPALQLLLTLQPRPRSPNVGFIVSLSDVRIYAPASNQNCGMCMKPSQTRSTRACLQWTKRCARRALVAQWQESGVEHLSSYSGARQRFVVHNNGCNALAESSQQCCRFCNRGEARYHVRLLDVSSASLTRTFVAKSSYLTLPVNHFVQCFKRKGGRRIIRLRDWGENRLA